MSLQKRKTSPYYYAVLYMDGRQQWISTKCKGKADAQAVHDEIKIRYQTRKREIKIAALLGEPLPENNSLQIKDTWETYCQLKPDWADTSRKHFNIFYQWFIMRYPKTMDISQVSKQIAVEYLYSNYIEKAPKTFNNVKSALSAIWHTLQIKADFDNPWKKIPNRALDSQKYRAFSRKEVKQVLDNSTGFWHYAALFAIYTGLRKKDITLLKWSDIKKDHIELEPAKTKRYGRSVYIPLHAEIKKALKTIPRNSEHLFPDYADRVGSFAYRTEFTALIKSLDISDTAAGKASFHSLRATFITRCEESGIDRKVIQGIVGHSSPSLTAYYSEDMESAKVLLNLNFSESGQNPTQKRA
jgi:integrase